MNESCRQQVARLLGRLPTPERVIEFGSRDVNGTIRDLLPEGAEYIGVDAHKGPNVDTVCAAEEYDPPWHPDLVLCLNMLEHTPSAAIILSNAWRILALGGALIVSVPDSGWEPHNDDGTPLSKGAFYHAMTEDELRHMLRVFAQVNIATVEKLIYAVAIKAGAGDEPSRKLNVGSGNYPLPGWDNLDSSELCNADIVADAMEYLLQCEDGRYDAIYAGHFLEHLDQEVALIFLSQCYRVLTPGGNLGILVPDTHEVMRRYVIGAPDAVQGPVGVWWPIKDLDTLNAWFLYSTVQESRHQWMWDQKTLGRAMMDAGFIGLREIDRWRDPRLGSGQWYQFGIDCWKPKEDASKTGR